LGPDLLQLVIQSHCSEHISISKTLDHQLDTMAGGLAMFAKRKPAAEPVAPEQTAVEAASGATPRFAAMAAVAANEDSVNYADANNDFDRIGNGHGHLFFEDYGNLDADEDANFFGGMAGAYDDTDHGQDIAAVADGMVGKSGEQLLE
jgi:hypothetical protein